MLAASTYNGYRRYIDRHIVPALGRIGLQRLRPHHLEALYDGLLYPGDGRAALAPKTVYEIHLIIRGALGDAVRRELVSQRRPHGPRPTAAVHPQDRTDFPRTVLGRRPMTGESSDCAR